MTRRERVLAAIQHKETDFVPYQVEFTESAYQKLVEYTGDPNFYGKIGNHIAGAGYGGSKEIRPGYFQDVFGVVWNRTVDKDIGVVEEILIKEPTLEGFKMPEIDEQKLRNDCEAVIANCGDLCRVFYLGFTIFERSWILRGMENLLMDMVINPDFVHELMDAICEWHLKILDIVLEYPFDGHYFGDDWGQQRGTIMGPEYWRTFIKPRVARMYAKVRNAGKFVAQHSCGDISQIFPDLIDIGLNAYQTFQPEIYDIKVIKREYGKDLTFWGGISTQRDLPYVSPDEVRQIVRETIRILGEGGGYIAGPTHSMPGDIPVENMLALIDALQNQKLN